MCCIPFALSLSKKAFEAWFMPVRTQLISFFNMSAVIGVKKKIILVPEIYRSHYNFVKILSLFRSVPDRRRQLKFFGQEGDKFIFITVK